MNDLDFLVAQRDLLLAFHRFAGQLNDEVASIGREPFPSAGFAETRRDIRRRILIRDVFVRLVNADGELERVEKAPHVGRFGRLDGGNDDDLIEPLSVPKEF